MSTPSDPDPVRGQPLRIGDWQMKSVGELDAVQHLDAIAAARAGGVPWDALGDEIVPDRAILDFDQMAESRRFMQWRSQFDVASDPQTVERGARILLARGSAPLVEKTLGLPPSGPESADFGDLKTGLDQWAETIHTSPGGNGNGNGHGRHAAP